MRNGFVWISFLSLMVASTTALADNAVTMGETTAEGGLPKDRAAAIIKENMSDVATCFKDGVKVPSSIKIELQLVPDQPVKARVLRATIGNRKKGRCLLDAASAWPLSVKQRTVVTQQFEIAAEGEAKPTESKDAKPKDVDPKKADKPVDDADKKKDAKEEKPKEEKADAKEKADKPAKDDKEEKADKSETKGDDGKKDADEKDADEKPEVKEEKKPEEPEEPAEPQGAIRLFRDIKLESTLDAAAVNAKVGEQHGELMACYMAVVAEKPKAAGHLDVKYTIADGKVTEAEVLKSTSIKGDAFATCSTEAVKKWEFEGGGVTVTQRFGFTPTKYFAGKAGLVVNLTGVEGPMPAASVIKVAVKKKRALAKCFKSSVRGKKAAITIATSNVVISPKGRAKADSISIDPETKKLEKCLTKAIKKLKFKKLKKGEDGDTTAKFEMIYTPKKKAFKVKKPKFR